MVRFFCLVVFLFGGNVLKGEQKLGKESVGGLYNLKGQSQILNININIYTLSLFLSLSRYTYIYIYLSSQPARIAIAMANEGL